MKKNIAGMAAVVMTAAMVVTFPVQAFAGARGGEKTMGYVTPCPVNTGYTATAPISVQAPVYRTSAYQTPTAAPQNGPVQAPPCSPAAASQQSSPAQAGAPSYSAVKMELSGAEEQTAAIDRRLQNANTQMEMTQLSSQKYQLWDNELNSVWKRLEFTLSADAMNRLRGEERAWIKAKEAAMNKEAQAYGIGSMAEMARLEKGAELTRARVYVLAEYLR